MKKIMMMTAVALVAGLAQAAAVSWNSGAIKSVADASGTFGANIGATSGTYLATVYFYADAGLTTAISGVTGNTDSTTIVSSTFAGTTSDSFAADTTYYAVLTITTESPYGAASLTSSALAFTTPGTGNSNINFLNAGVMPSQWTVVPEPTSMALLAFGVAALGLRRRFRK